MIHHAVHFQLKPGVDAAAIVSLVRTSRSMLLKIPEVLVVRSGRNLDPESPWQFFFAIEVVSRAKLRVALDDAVLLKLLDHVIGPLATDRIAMDYELDPSKDLKYS